MICPMAEPIISGKPSHRSARETPELLSKFWFRISDRCTRACHFCAVTTAKPFPLESSEPARVSEAARRLGLKHVVITAVARDDLPDGGADHFRQTIASVRAGNPGIVIEILVPDFRSLHEGLPFLRGHDRQAVSPGKQRACPGLGSGPPAWFETRRHHSGGA